MENFKLGDRVIALRECEGNVDIVDKTGRIVALYADQAIVEFEEYVGGHNGNKNGKDGHCWIIPNDPTFLHKAFENNAKECQEKIVIISNGNVVEARLYKNGRVSRGYAKCSPKDNFDFLTGAKLALQRLEETEKVIEPSDKVKIVDSGYIYSAYSEWIKKHAPKFLENYCYNVNPKVLYTELEKEQFTVVAKGEHEDGEEIKLLLIQDRYGRCFIINEKGVEIIEN